MCNYCDCENYHLCSIVGNIPLGFCCPKCVYYNEERTCIRSKMNVEMKIPRSLLNESGKVKLFSDNFCLKTARDVHPDQVEDKLETY